MQSPSSQKARRVRVERGIYRRETPAGRRYEITYTDSSGKQRWKTVEGGLVAARAERADIVGKLYRGERVAPTKATLAEIAEDWLEQQDGRLRRRTVEWYRTALRRHVLPRLGRRRIATITEDDVARLIAEMRNDGYAGWTVRGVLTPFGRVLGHAARRGMIASNPIRRLERGERPSVGRMEMRVLDSNEIAKVLEKTPALYRPLLATAIFTGLRQGELLGLTWTDVDFDAGLVRVRKQLGRDGIRVEPKTPQAVRDVPLMPALGRMLREHKLASRHSAEADFVFASATGTPLHFRNVSRRGLEKAVKDAELAEPRPRFHDLRHTAASLLIAEGLNVVYVSRQLGHASPDITLRVYAHLFDRAEHAQRARDALEAGFGHMLAGEER